jgi:hypothetical protein
MNDAVEAGRASRKGRRRPGAQSLSEDATTAGIVCAAEPSDDHLDCHSAPVRWKVGDCAAIMTVDPARHYSAARTLADLGRGARLHNRPAILICNSVDHKTFGEQSRTKASFGHARAPESETAMFAANCTKIESQPNLRTYLQ